MGETYLITKHGEGQCSCTAWLTCRSTTSNKTPFVWFVSLKSVRRLMWFWWAPRSWTSTYRSRCPSSAPCWPVTASACVWTSGTGSSSASWDPYRGSTRSCWSWNSGGAAESCWSWPKKLWTLQRSGRAKRRRGPQWTTRAQPRRSRLILSYLWPACAWFTVSSRREQPARSLSWWALTLKCGRISGFQSFFRGYRGSASPLRLRRYWLGWVCADRRGGWGRRGDVTPRTSSEETTQRKWSCRTSSSINTK